MREASKDFLLCAYEMSHIQDGKDNFLKDINSKTPKFYIIIEIPSGFGGDFL